MHFNYHINEVMRLNKFVGGCRGNGRQKGKLHCRWHNSLWCVVHIAMSHTLRHEVDGIYVGAVV